jgi:hypothetical protein
MEVLFFPENEDENGDQVSDTVEIPHPGCGGALTLRCIPVLVLVRVTEAVYSPEGYAVSSASA